MLQAKQWPNEENGKISFKDLRRIDFRQIE
jgi:hypothetical protein